MARARSTRQLEVQESAAHRAELKSAVLKFLSLASKVEKAALARWGSGGAAVGAQLDQLLDDLRMAHAEIDLAARSEPLRGAAHRYAARLAEGARSGMSDGSALRGPQAQFFDAAYDDMWPPTTRSSSTPTPGPSCRSAGLRPPAATTARRRWEESEAETALGDTTVIAHEGTERGMPTGLDRTD
ncbi:hypothetical protein ACH41H_03355 [Streptomyces sp. NPDC020800]|uniref:hypothetical protein n=1 Tax=Streptomyces sp. NPDC020800 TaxID=3365092 RepID=UPI0037B34D75